jgi:SAM-dependent methyltransferase
LQTHGLETNPLAVETCRQKGHAVFLGYLADYARSFPEARFDLITAFQVLEHVPDPVGLLSEAAALARPGAGVVIGVPNENGIMRICPLDPHQWPPHHVSRWRLQDLRELGRRAGLSVAASGTYRMHSSDLKHFWTLHNKLAVALGRKPYRGGKFLPKCISWVYRKTGSKYFLPRFGSSIYAFYQKNAST